MQFQLISRVSTPNIIKAGTEISKNPESLEWIGATNGPIAILQSKLIPGSHVIYSQFQPSGTEMLQNWYSQEGDLLTNRSAWRGIFTTLFNKYTKVIIRDDQTIWNYKMYIKPRHTADKPVHMEAYLNQCTCLWKSTTCISQVTIDDSLATFIIKTHESRNLQNDLAQLWLVKMGNFDWNMTISQLRNITDSYVAW